MALFDQAPDLAVGNIVGSNLANILLIGGVAAALMPLSTAAVGLRFNALLLVLVSLVLSAMVISGHLNPFIGAGLIAVKAFSLVKSFRGCVAPEGEEVQPEVMGPWRAATLALGGAILVGGGGYALVESAEELAHLWGVPSAVIGLSIIAVGTSLPELAATIAAVRQRQGDLIMGNIIGSNLANILIVLGFTALFAPGRIHDAGAYVPLLILMMVATLILAGFVVTRRAVGRPIGLALLIAYGLFILISFLIGGGPIHD